MINIFSDLEQYGIPAYVEGNAPEELPDEYLTISEDYSSDNLSADNQTKEIVYEWSIKYYTKDATNIYTGLINALNYLKGKGYITTGSGYTNATYKATWYSRQADIKKVEYLN